jgi:hypothetical protein
MRITLILGTLVSHAYVSCLCLMLSEGAPCSFRRGLNLMFSSESRDKALIFFSSIHCELRELTVPSMTLV